MRLMKSGLVAVLLSLGLLAQTAAPAGAASVAVGAAVVRVQTSTGLGYPEITPPNPGTFTITTTIACAAVGLNVNKVGKAPVDIALHAPPVPPLPPPVGSCSITGTGTFAAPGANCGRSTGTVTGTVRVGINTIDYTGTFQTAASAVVITGTASKPSGQSGLFVFVGDATPDPTAGTSCTNKTQREFIVVGVSVGVLM